MFVFDDDDMDISDMCTKSKWCSDWLLVPGLYNGDFDSIFYSFIILKIPIVLF